jgi:hypothetical protein
MGLAARTAHIRHMEKILAPKLLENPVMNPQAKKLARKQLVQRAVLFVEAHGSGARGRFKSR